METTDYIDVLYEAGEEVALDPENLTTGDAATLRRAARRWLEKCWEYHYWPQLEQVEQRWFAADWDNATAYVAGDVVFNPADETYYEALRASTGEDPESNLGYWAEAETIFAAADYEATVDYAQGDQVYYRGNTFQCHTATTAGTLPSNTSYWGQRHEFQREISYTQSGQTEIGLVAAVTNYNPRIHTRGTELNWQLTSTGIVVKGDASSAWVSFRERCPKLIGDTFDADTAYLVGQQVYYAGTSGSTEERGNFYDCVTATSAGETPLSAPSKWAKVELPRIFHKPLVQGMASAWVRGPGGGTLEEAMAYESYAQAALEDQKTLVVGQQSQRVKTVVMTR